MAGLSVTRGRLQPGFRDLGYEVIPLKRAEEQVRQFVPTDVSLTVTASPVKGQDATIDLAVSLSRHGYRVTPHFSAQQVRDKVHLLDLLETCRAHSIAGAFVVGGDPAGGPTQFPDAHALLVAMNELGHPFQSIGIGGHPEGHPAVSDDALFQALEDKAEFADYVTTQIAFDPGVILRWAQELKRRGIDLPVRVGVPGAVRRQKLLRVSGNLGVGESARFLRKQQNLLWRFFTPSGYSPDKVMSGLTPHIGRPDNAIERFHVFTFNDLESTEAWRKRNMHRPDVSSRSDA
jgi:methylenetetrahydrofolate reductase (NADPH)